LRWENIAKKRCQQTEGARLSKEYLIPKRCWHTVKERKRR